jgi:hypothetical protein
MQNLIPLWEKVIAALHSVTGYATNQMLPVVVDQSHTSLWRNFVPLLNCFNAVIFVGFQA